MQKGRPEDRSFPELNRMAQMRDVSLTIHVHVACSARLTR